MSYPERETWHGGVALTYVNCLCQVCRSCFDSPQIVVGLLISSAWEAGLEQLSLRREQSVKVRSHGEKEGVSLHSPSHLISVKLAFCAPTSYNGPRKPGRGYELYRWVE